MSRELKRLGKDSDKKQQRNSFLHFLQINTLKWNQSRQRISTGTASDTLGERGFVHPFAGPSCR